VRVRALFCIALPTVWAAVAWNGMGQHLSGMAMITEAHAQGDAVATVDVWRVGIKVDPLDRTRTLQATATVSTDDARFEMVAKCDSGSINITFTVFHAGTNYGWDLKRVSNGTSDSVSIRTTLDEGQVSIRQEESEYPNQVHLFPSTQDLAQATAWRVELPLDNGETPVIVLNLRSISFRSFLSTCTATEARRRDEVEAQAQRNFSAALARAPLMQMTQAGTVALNEKFGLSDMTIDQDRILPGRSLVKVLETQKEPTYGYVWSKVVGVDQNGNPLQSHNGVIIEGWTRADFLQQPGSAMPPNSATSIYLGGPRVAPPRP